MSTTDSAKASDLALRAAIWGAIESLTSGASTMALGDPRFLSTPPAELCALLVEAVGYGCQGIEMAAVAGELLGIEGDPKCWEAQVAQALADRIEAAEGPLRAERDRYKTEYPGDTVYADLPSGLFWGLPSFELLPPWVRRLGRFATYLIAGGVGFGLAVAWIGGRP